MPRKPGPAALLAGLFGLLAALFVGVGVFFVYIDHAPPAPHIVAARHIGAPAFAPEPAYPEGLIDLNRADIEALKTLPGIGDTLARRIVASRPLYYPEDLLSVRGIGDKRFSTLRALVAVYAAERGE